MKTLPMAHVRNLASGNLAMSLYRFFRVDFYFRWGLVNTTNAGQAIFQLLSLSRDGW